jgi:hypothetical protein
MTNLLREIRSCRQCASDLPHAPRPVIRGCPSRSAPTAITTHSSRVNQTPSYFNDSGDTCDRVTPIVSQGPHAWVSLFLDYSTFLSVIRIGFHYCHLLLDRECDRGHTDADRRSG